MSLHLRGIFLQATADSTSAAATRIRENQRRSRARRKEYVQGMERRIAELERRASEAAEADGARRRQQEQQQQAMRAVAAENSRLRLLGRMGALPAEVEAFLHSWRDGDTALPASSGSLHGDEPDRGSRAPPGANLTRLAQQPHCVGIKEGCGTCGCVLADSNNVNNAQPPSRPDRTLAGRRGGATPLLWAQQGAAAFDKLEVLASASMSQRWSAAEAPSHDDCSSPIDPSSGDVTPSLSTSSTLSALSSSASLSSTSSYSDYHLQQAQHQRQDHGVVQPIPVLDMSCSDAAQIIAAMHDNRDRPNNSYSMDPQRLPIAQGNVSPHELDVGVQ